jgi:predicted transcriptional regulator
MATKPTGKPRGRPSGEAKVSVFSRIDPAAIDALDEIAAAMDPKPTRAQLIDRAVREFVERQKQRPKT